QPWCTPSKSRGLRLSGTRSGKPRILREKGDLTQARDRVWTGRRAGQDEYRQEGTSLADLT
ncbi:MAG: hypothetical protein Q7U84_08570, partial [Polynucleobacter sp.]|nr:hypothetical protein [Polynucleobacter sp.]